MASIVGVITPDALKARQKSAQEQRNAAPLVHRPFLKALADLKVRDGVLVKARRK